MRKQDMALMAHMFEPHARGSLSGLVEEMLYHANYVRDLIGSGIEPGNSWVWLDLIYDEFGRREPTPRALYACYQFVVEDKLMNELRWTRDGMMIFVERFQSQDKPVGIEILLTAYLNASISRLIMGEMK